MYQIGTILIRDYLTTSDPNHISSHHKIMLAKVQIHNSQPKPYHHMPLEHISICRIQESNREEKQES